MATKFSGTYAVGFGDEEDEDVGDEVVVVVGFGEFETVEDGSGVEVVPGVTVDVGLTVEDGVAVLDGEGVDDGEPVVVGVGDGVVVWVGEGVAEEEFTVTLQFAIAARPSEVATITFASFLPTVG